MYSKNCIKKNQSAHSENWCFKCSLQGVLQAKKFHKIKLVQTDPSQGQKSKKFIFFWLCIAYIANRVAHIELSIAFNLIPTSTS